MIPFALTVLFSAVALAVVLHRSRRRNRRQELVTTARRRREERQRLPAIAPADGAWADARSEAILDRTRELAHSFDDLLTVINGCAELLRHEADAGPGSRAIGAEIRRAGEKAVRVNRQLLALGMEDAYVLPVPETRCGNPGTVVSTQETILLVEDEDLIRSLAHRVLESRGYRVFSAPCAADALDLHGKLPGKVDLVLTDVVMPGLGGRELAERLSAAQPDLRVLYMSGFNNDVILEEGIRADAVHFLQKPFSPDTLARKVRDVLFSPTPA